jgi:hypothetical protein
MHQMQGLLQSLRETLGAYPRGRQAAIDLFSGKDGTK